MDSTDFFLRVKLHKSNRASRNNLNESHQVIFFSPQLSVIVFGHSFTGRGVRAVEGARLESVCWGNPTVGSNPTLSAISLFHTGIASVFADCYRLGVYETRKIDIKDRSVERHSTGNLKLSPPNRTRTAQ